MVFRLAEGAVVAEVVPTRLGLLGRYCGSATGTLLCTVVANSDRDTGYTGTPGHRDTGTVSIVLTYCTVPATLRVRDQAIADTVRVLV